MASTTWHAWRGVERARGLGFKMEGPRSSCEPDVTYVHAGFGGA